MFTNTSAVYPFTFCQKTGPKATKPCPNNRGVLLSHPELRVLTGAALREEAENIPANKVILLHFGVIYPRFDLMLSLQSSEIWKYAAASYQYFFPGPISLSVEQEGINLDVVLTTFKQLPLEIVTLETQLLVLGVQR